MRIILGLFAFLLSSAPAWALGGFITGDAIDTPAEQSTLMIMVGLFVALVIALIVSKAVNRARGASGQ
jgi:hypothetical protein